MILPYGDGKREKLHYFTSKRDHRTWGHHLLFNYSGKCDAEKWDEKASPDLSTANGSGDNYSLQLRVKAQGALITSGVWAGFDLKVKITSHGTPCLTADHLFVFPRLHGAHSVSQHPGRATTQSDLISVPDDTHARVGLLEIHCHLRAWTGRSLQKGMAGYNSRLWTLIKPKKYHWPLLPSSISHGLLPLDLLRGGKLLPLWVQPVTQHTDRKKPTSPVPGACFLPWSGCLRGSLHQHKRCASQYKLNLLARAWPWRKPHSLHPSALKSGPGALYLLSQGARCRWSEVFVLVVFNNLELLLFNYFHFIWKIVNRTSV